ncbi:hypothetical protein BLNAU_23298 [Blattamonas nauphoetae]|uniref:Uncharacterized protein n=1 Tax=Blattamonas nauphoetae TaxID=2049346 RepID=A0ABQ9WR47_9EUKA|nr:hypothetical protein BLNAU_23298 [Blattamonas nauphoetae]
MITHLTKEEYDAAQQGQKQLREFMMKGETATKMSLLSVHQQNKHNVIKSAENQKWRSTHPVNRYHKINNNVFRCALDNLYLKPPLSFSEATQDHAGCCKRTSSERLVGHHSIKFLLAQTLKEIPSITVRTEIKRRRDEESVNEEEAYTIADLQFTVTTSFTKHSFARDIIGIKDEGQTILEFGLYLDILQDFTSRSHPQRGMMDPRGSAKEVERKKTMNTGRTLSLSFDEIKRRIAALHNNEDRKKLYLSTNRRTREQVHSGEKLKIINATKEPNSNSTPSLSSPKFQFLCETYIVHSQ